MTIAERLRALSAELTRVQTEIQILDEQIAFQSEVSDDARLRALVSETPIADRESQEATRDLHRMQRQHAELLERQEALRAEQDQLLERMLDEPR